MRRGVADQRREGCGAAGAERPAQGAVAAIHEKPFDSRHGANHWAAIGRHRAKPAPELGRSPLWPGLGQHAFQRIEHRAGTGSLQRQIVTANLRLTCRANAIPSKLMTILRASSVMLTSGALPSGAGSVTE